MLVLTRKVNEAIVIDGNIRVVVVEIGDGRVRIGVEADKSIPIHRGEVQDRIDGKEGTEKA